MGDDAFQDAIGEAVDVFLGEAPPTDLFDFPAGRHKVPGVPFAAGRFYAYFLAPKLMGLLDMRKKCHPRAAGMLREGGIMCF